uniref:GB1/RHD3-type G domain-containing protein n=1 Tax=Strigamia maritima TaxID=126957 RepID=T1J894_STRMM
MVSWTSPKPFIFFQNNKLQLNNDVLYGLEQVDIPLIPVCIAGRLRSGKSYLMNRLVGRKTGFPLGCTVEAVTKGIWVWYIEHPSKKNVGLLVMDTEGLDDPDGGYEDYDMAILSLSILLSSTLIYNEIGLIGNSLIDKLNFVTEMSRRIKCDTNANSDADFDGFFPQFVLAIRDLTLELKIDGLEVTDDEYMEKKMLTANKNATTNREKKRNETKLKLRQYFPHRKCFTFISPLQELKVLKKPEDMSDIELPNAFVEKSNDFCNFIYQNSKVKKLKLVQPVTGPIFVQLAKIYLEAINKNTIPCVESAINLIAESENVKALEDAMVVYSRTMAATPLPVDKEELEKSHTTSHTVAINYFLRKVFLDENKKYQEKLQAQLAREYIRYVEQNQEASHSKCMKILDQLYLPMSIKMKSGAYVKRGGYEEYTEDLDELERKYNQIPNKGALSDVSIQTFLVNRKRDRDTIVRALLTKCEREREHERAEQEQVKLKTQLDRAKEGQAKENEELLRRTIAEQLQLLEEKHQADLEQQKQAFEQLIEMREREQRRLLEETFAEEAVRLRNEVDKLKSKKTNIMEYISTVAESLGDMLHDMLLCKR